MAADVTSRAIVTALMEGQSVGEIPAGKISAWMLVAEIDEGDGPELMLVRPPDLDPRHLMGLTAVAHMNIRERVEGGALGDIEGGS